MLRLLSITLLLSSFAFAQASAEKIADFLEDKFLQNPRLKSVDVAVIDTVPLQQVKGWNAYIVDVEAVLKQGDKKIKQKMIWFSDGRVITKELSDMKDGSNITELVKPKFRLEYYTKENLIYGKADAKHKIAIFSDPLCPFCKAYVPETLKYLKKYPDTFGVYYYHFPLERLHPASVHLVKMAAAAEQKGVKDFILKLYSIKINPREKDIKKILKAFNKAVGTKLTEADINTPDVLKQVNHDYDIADKVMVGGTPTVYFDGKVDHTKKKYLTVKVEK
jgi:predicted DsbA family dithiol-disulfide isomerase